MHAAARAGALRNIDGGWGAAAAATARDEHRGKGHGHCHPFRKGFRHASVSNVLICFNNLGMSFFPVNRWNRLNGRT
ncbi:hypothetical protein BSIN_2615 [Burkholderia singularis]|uniref:Uncharacterized protein n=1 Tax=Burkholderia singularis TaxID=1503053 RepID=A0A238HBM3_9BURK|nr:hypothetical protein BSIN_2615 [Burkholderia singularis]